VLRRIFGPRRNEVTAYWRKLQNEELHNLCSSPNKIRVNKLRWMKWAGHVAGIRRRGMAAGHCKPEGNSSLRSSGRKWVDNIKWLLD
jgi:hypothetical protein